MEVIILLSESLAWSLENYDCSGIRVYCDKSIAKEITDSFMSEFNDLWEEAAEEGIEKAAEYMDNHPELFN